LSYGNVSELVRRLGLNSPTQAALDQAQAALDAAAFEIDSYLGWTVTGPPTLDAGRAAIVEQVNYDRAQEHWRNPAFGALGQGPELAPVLVARNSWYRHGVKLLPLKIEFGVG
jgi:hypothetical protein